MYLNKHRRQEQLQQQRQATAQAEYSNVLIIPDTELRQIVTTGENRIQSYRISHPKWHDNKIINYLIASGTIHHDFRRLRVLFGMRERGYAKADTLAKWGIVAIDKCAWVEFHLLKDWNKPTTKKGKFKATANPKPTKQKSVKSENNPCPTDDEIRALTAFCYYTDLRTTNPSFNPPNLNNHATLQGLNANEVLSCFNDYLDHENQTIKTLDNGLDNEYKFYNFMQSHAPDNHRTKSCRSGSSTFYYNKQNKKPVIINEKRCYDPFCSYCNNVDGTFKENLARQVDETVIANGGQCLQLTLAPPPHTTATKLCDITPKMKKAYALFNRKTANLIKELGYHGKLKRFDPVYSLNNGHHPHIHVAYAIDGITDEQLEHLQSLMYEIWLSCMIEFKLLKKKDRKEVKARGMACDLRINPHAFQYVARKHKSKFTIQDLPALAMKAKTKALSVHELGYLAMNKVGITLNRFERVYQEILTEFYETTQLKYSRGFLSELGLKEYSHKSQSKPPSDTQPKKAPIPPVTPPVAPVSNDKGQFVMDLQPPTNDNNQFLLFDRIDTKKPRKQRSDKGKPRTKSPPLMTATTKHDSMGQGVLFKGSYTAYYPTMPKKGIPKHLIPLATLTYEQMTALTQAKAIGLYAGMLEHAYKQGYFKDNIPYHWYLFFIGNTSNANQRAGGACVTTTPTAGQGA